MVRNHRRKLGAFGLLVGVAVVYAPTQLPAQFRGRDSGGSTPTPGTANESLSTDITGLSIADQDQQVETKIVLHYFQRQIRIFSVKPYFLELRR